MLHGQRESDGDYPVSFHPSYTSRPKVEFQLAASASHLEGRRGVQAASVMDMPPRAVPTTFDTVHDPQHPQADWGGFVSKDAGFGKKSFAGHASQRIGLVQTEDGIISRHEKQEWAHRRRGADDGSNTSSKLRNGNAGIIGGIGCENRWETENQRFASSRPTGRDQLTLLKQAMPRVPIRDPAQARSRVGGGMPLDERSQYSQHSQREQYGQQNEYDGHRLGEENMSLHETSLLGYRGPPQTMSLVSNLASQIMDAVPSQPVSTLVRQKGPVKEISSAIPGYTGYRRRGL